MQRTVFIWCHLFCTLRSFQNLGVLFKRRGCYVCTNSIPITRVPVDSSRPTGAGGHLQHPFISAAGAGPVAFWFIPWDVVSNRDGYTVERIVSSRRNARETPTEVKALGRNKIIETLEIVSPFPPRSRKPVHQDLVYVFRLSFIYVYMCALWCPIESPRV